MYEQTNSLGKFVPWKTKKPESYVKTLSLKVPREAVGRLGDVQGLISLITDAKTGNVLAANIEEVFNDGLDEIIKKLPFSTSFETTFENVIARVNLMLLRLLGDRGLSIAKTDMHGVIIAQKGRDVAAAVWGKPSLVLFRRNGEGGPKLFNILETEIENSLMQTVGIGFTNLVSGKINGKDRMIISNRNLLELLDDKCLQDILSVPKTETVTMLLRDALLARHEDLNLAMLLLDGYIDSGVVEKQRHNFEEKPIKSRREKQVEAATSVVLDEKLPIALPAQLPIHRRAELNIAHHIGSTKKIFSYLKTGLKRFLVRIIKLTKKLGIAIGINIRKILIFGKNIIEKKIGKTANSTTLTQSEQSTELESLAQKIRSPKKLETTTIVMTDIASDSAGKNRFKNILNMIKTIEWRTRTKQITTFAKNKWNILTGKSKRLLITVVALAMILIISLGSIGIKNLREKSLAKYEKTVAEIQQQIASAEASLIYRDEERARRLLAEATAGIAGLPENNKNRTAIKLQLTQEMNAKFAGLRHAITLEAPEILSTVVTQSGTPDLRQLIMIGNTLWAISVDGTIFKISPTDGTATIISSGNNALPKIFLALNSGLLVGDSSSLEIISSTDKITPLSIDTSGIELDFNSAAVFNSKLYLLDATHNRIVKFASVTGGYASPQIYTKDGTDLSNATSLTIDGSIYVLSNNGNVIKFLNGKAENYKLDTIDPLLTTPISIETPNVNADLFILDTTQHRVVRFDKETGHLVAQYESVELEGVTSIQINQTNHMILATKGNRILRFTWTEYE